MNEVVIYNGGRYYLQSSGKYFQASKKKELCERLLHRCVWSDVHGEIPEGFHVHHIDHDWRNNDISNLECIEGKVHQSNHMKERFKCEDYRELNKNQLDLIRPLTKKWHSSSEGISWHKKHAENTLLNVEKVIYECVVCGKSYKAESKGTNKFCSKACTQKQYYEDNKVSSECIKCGEAFQHYKYRRQSYCSYACSGESREVNHKYNCLNCGVVFEHKKKGKKFCAYKCYNESRKLQNSHKVV